MHISIERIEELTSAQLRQLPLHKGEEDEEECTIYSEAGITYLEEEDELSASESAFMRGYIDFSYSDPLLSS